MSYQNKAKCSVFVWGIFSLLILLHLSILTFDTLTLLMMTVPLIPFLVMLTCYLMGFYKTVRLLWMLPVFMIFTGSTLLYIWKFWFTF